MSELEDEDLDFPLPLFEEDDPSDRTADVTGASFSKTHRRVVRPSSPALGGTRRVIRKKYPQSGSLLQGNSRSDTTRKKVTVLRRRYRIIRLLGGGGYGKVYLARDLRLDIDVAIKELLQTTNDPTQMQQAEQAFVREAKMLAGLSHESLPRVFDVFSVGQRSYLVMEYIEGETLESYVARVGVVVDPGVLDPDFPARGRVLPIQKVLAIGIEICQVFDYLHTHEPPVIFRDLKPTNIMIQAKTGRLFLIDFGIARHFKPGQQTDTVALGSPGYAPPEQYGKAQTTARSDIYSLGALLHQLVTGDDPSANPFIFSPLLPRVQHLDVDIEGFELLLLQMVNIEVEKRPKSASEVRKQLVLHFQRASNVSPDLPRLEKSASNASKRTFSLPSQPLVELVRISLPCPVVCAAWSPSSDRIVTGSTDGTIRVWNRGGRELVSFLSTTVAPLSINWSPDGHFLAVINQGAAEVQVWDADTGVRKLRYLNPARAAVWSAGWSSDGKHFALGDKERSVTIWDIASKDLLATISHPQESVGISLLSWSPDSACLAFNGRIRYPMFSGERKEAISVWGEVFAKKGGQFSARRRNMLYDRFFGNIVSMSWSEDSIHLASVHRQTRSSWDKKRFWRLYTVSIWDTKTGKCVVAEKQLADLPRILWWQGDILGVIDDSGWLRRYDLKGRVVSAQCLIPHHPKVIAVTKDRTILARASQDNPQLLLLEALPQF